MSTALETEAAVAPATSITAGYEKRLMVTTGTHRHLIHDADRRANKVGFNRLRQPRQSGVIKVQFQQCSQSTHQADDERRAR